MDDHIHEVMRMSKKSIFGILFAIVILAVLGIGYWKYQQNPYLYKAKTESNLFTLGQISASKGQHLEAINYFKDLLKKDPKHSVAIKFMLESMIQVPNMKEETLAALDQLIALDPTKNNLEFASSVSLQLGEKDRAEGYLKQIKETVNQ